VVSSNSCCRSLISDRVSDCCSGTRLTTGSSMISTFGLRTTALASATVCRCSRVRSPGTETRPPAIPILPDPVAGRPTSLAARGKGVALERQSHVTIVDGGMGDVDAVDEDGPGLRGLEAVEHPQDRRLARTGRAVEDEELSGVDEEIEGVDGFGCRVLVDMTEAIQRHR